ncbi:hypothetical protein Tco_1303681 [Tanacetum coccineum]
MAFLVDNRDTVTTSQKSQEIPTLTIFQTGDLDAFDSDCHEAPSSSAILMAKLSAYDSDVLSEVANPDTYQINNVVDQTQRKVPALYCGHAIVQKHDALSIMDTEETLLLAEESLAKEITDMKVVFNQMDSDEQYLVHPAVNSLATIIDYQSMEKSYLDKYNEYVNLKAELLKKNEMVEKVVYNEHSKRCSRLESHCIFLEIEKQQLNESERERHDNQQFKKHIANLKGKAAADCSETAKEHVDTFRDSVEQARAQQPLDSALEYACKFTTRIHALLVYVSATCPSSLHVNEKLVAITPMNKSKKVRFEEPMKSTSNIPTLADSKKSKITNQPLLTSTGVKSSTSASGSQPSGNTKKK